MLETLNLVRGAVSDKDIVSVLTHFYFYDGRVQGTDGRVYIDAPCPEIKQKTVVPAEKFLRAIDACDGEPKIRFTDKGQMVIEKKPFRALLPCQPPENFPFGQPTPGKPRQVVPALMAAIKTLRPFLGADAARTWASTALFDKGSGMAFAANNAMIAIVPAKGIMHETTQIPVFMIDELLRIARPPTGYTIDENSITFFWGDLWLRSQLINAEWPLETAKKWSTAKTEMTAVPKNLIASIQSMIPFCLDPKFPVIFFNKEGIATAPGETRAEIVLPSTMSGVGAFRADNLIPMLKNADRMGITKDAAIFRGPNNFHGIMAALRIKS